MADGTVSNHDTIIATKGTPHIAKARPSTADHCFDPTKKPVVFGDNEIETTKLAKGKPTKTFITNEPPWTANGWLDEGPSWPAHAGVGGGVTKNVGAKGLNYIQYAYPTSYSEDVKVEGFGVVRTDDTTKQNGGNCDGYVDGSNLKQWVDSTTDLMKKKCTIKKVTGKCGHGRELGAPPNADKGGDGFFLDVLGGDTVTIDSVRKDVSVPGKELPPSCGKHTFWHAHRTGIDGLDVKKDHIGDQFIITAAVLKDPMPKLSSGFKEETEANGLKTTSTVGASEGTAERTKRRTEAVAMSRAQATAVDLTEAGSTNVNVTVEHTTKKETDAKKAAAAKNPPALDRRGAGKKEEEAFAGRVKTATTVAEVAKLLAELWLHWQFENKPPVVNVAAIACSGAKHVKLRVFPAEPVKYQIPVAWMQKIADKLHSFGNLTKMVNDKLKCQSKFEFLQGFKCEFQLAFKELTADRNGRFKTEVRRSWSLTLKIEKVIYLYAEGNLSFITLLGNGIFPGLGTVLDELASLGGFTLSGFLSMELKLGFSISGGIDEYDEGTMSGTEAALVGTVKLGVKAEYDGKAGHFKAWANTIWENCVKAQNFRRADTPEAWAQFDVVGYVQLGAEAGYVADLFNWNAVTRATIGVQKGGSVVWKPEWLKLPAGGANLGTIVVRPLKS